MRESFARLQNGSHQASFRLMETGTLIGTLSKHLFWDVDAESMNTESHRSFIITRVMDRGTSPDVQAVWNQYGEETVKEVLLHAPSLQRKTIFFFANQFQMNPEEFRAYRKSEELGIWEQ